MYQNCVLSAAAVIVAVFGVLTSSSAMAGDVEASRIERWDGSKWFAVGSGITGVDWIPYVYAMTVFNDGSGSGHGLFVGCQFTHAGGRPAHHLAKWQGCPTGPE